jgi:hypothetical protein
VRDDLTHMTNPGTDFQSSETFAYDGPVGATTRRLLPMMIGLSLSSALLVALILTAIGVRFGLVIGLVVGAALCVTLYAMKQRQVRTVTAVARLDLSLAGLTTTDRYTQVHLPWSQIRQLGKADTMAPAHIKISGKPLINLLTGATVAAAKRAGRDALIGHGTQTLSKDAPALLRNQTQKSLAARPRDPAGNPLVAIILEHYEHDWRHGRIGQWIATYRKDLIA